jgi:putative ABC transport system permease protein
MILALVGALLMQAAHPTIAVDERLASDRGLRVGDRIVISGTPGGGGDTVQIAAIVRRRADPSEVARGEYRVRLHLPHLERLLTLDDRVDRFAVATRGGPTTDSLIRRVNDVAFGYRAYRSSEIAVETSKTFQVVSRFHDAIGIITIAASAVFLLCIMLLKVDERRRDVGALRLIGISRRSIVGSVVLEATLTALLGSAFGAGLGWVMSVVVNAHYQRVYRTPLVFAMVTGHTVLVAVALAIALGVAAGALAARRLVRLRPSELLGR